MNKTILTNWLKICRPYRSKIIISFVLILLTAITAVLFPWLLRYLLDAIINNKGVHALIIGTAAILITKLLETVINHGHFYITESVAKHLSSDLRKQVFGHLQKLPLKYYEEKQTGQIMARITSDIEVIEEAIKSELKESPTKLLILIGAAGIMIYMNFTMGILAAIIFPILINALRYIRFRITKITEKIQNDKAALSATLEESISGIRIIKSCNAEQSQLDHFFRINNDIFKNSMYETKFNTVLGIFVGTFSSLAIAAILILGGHAITQHTMSTGQLVAFLFYMQVINSNTVKVFRGYIAIQKIKAASARLFAITEQQPEEPIYRQLPSLPAIKGDIEFNGVEFSYNKRIPVLKNISFSVAPGETVAIVGANGAGKSTIIKLLSRFYEPNAGFITIDKYPIQNFSIASLRKQIATVFQEDLLFNCSIADNISYGTKNPAPDKIKLAAQMANADIFIKKLPDGYNTLTGDRGTKLSGGQRQRIGIARALYRCPAILCLDEALSYVDTESELLIQDALKKISARHTVLIMAQRPSTILNATKIIILDNGIVQAVGTPKELLSNNPLYNHLLYGGTQT